MPKQRDQQLLKRIGKRFQQVRLENGYSQEALGGKIGVESQTLSRYENGSRGISITVLARAADAMEVDLADLLNVSAKRQKPKQTPDEAKLFRIWKTLSPKQKDLVFRILVEITK